MIKNVRNMPRRQQKAVMASIKNRDPGRTPHEMIEDSLLYGVDRFNVSAEKRLQQIDRDLGIDPAIGNKRRNAARCEREALLQLAGRGAAADHMDYMAGIRGLAEKGDIRQKARGKGWMITPQGRRHIKEMDAAVLRHLKNVPTR